MTLSDLRSALKKLSDIKDYHGAGFMQFPGLAHRLYRSAESKTPKAWSTFFTKVRSFRSPDSEAYYQNSFHVPSSDPCVCHWYLNSLGYEMFFASAVDAYQTLVSIRELAKDEDGLRINLPSTTGIDGWLELIYHTAKVYSSLFNYYSYRFGTHYDEGRYDLEAPIKEASIYNSTYNIVVSGIAADIFLMSYVAIGLWLSPLTDGQQESPVDLSQLPLAAGYTTYPPAMNPKPRIDLWKLVPRANRPESPPPPRKKLKPRWTPCPTGGELWYGGKLIKRLKAGAARQRSVLETFQKQRWRSRISLLATEFDSDKVNDTIYHLNRDHETQGLLKFRGDGTGMGVVWEVLSVTSQTEN